ncbi:Bug family tripartite tricarboxylate transporter substrate binding protein [Pollutimonas nitritireducens]|nr:tripartite tricarboxylate transporter substrate binding protein [Pollutimonas nitritireducens]
MTEKAFKGLKSFRRMLSVALSLSVFGLAPQAWAAESYPAKPVRVIVPFNAGGSTDVVARAVAKGLSEKLGQTFVVENKGGAGSAIGTAEVARAKADGYTLLFTTSYFSLNPAITKNVNYDPVKDFTPITNIAFMPMVLFAKADLPAKTVAEVISLAKENPGKLNYASSGNGGPPHFAGALFGKLAGVQITHIPYGGAAPALLDVAAGRVDISFSTFSSALPFLKSGRIRAIAVASNERFADFPDVPTFAEAGLQGLDMATMYALLAPAGTPRPVVDRIYQTAMDLIAEPAMRKLIIEQGAQVVGNSPDEFAAFIRADVARWAKMAAETEGVRQE